MWDHSVNCHPTRVNAPSRNLQPGRPLLDLPTPAGWKAELTLVLVIHVGLYRGVLTVQR